MHAAQVDAHCFGLQRKLCVHVKRLLYCIGLVGIVGCVFVIDILNVVEFGLGLYIRLRRNDFCESLELIENLGPFVRVTKIEVDRYCFIDIVTDDVGLG